MNTDQSDGLVILTSANEDPPAFLMALRGSAGAWTLHDLENAFAKARNSGDPLIVDLSALTSGDEVLLGFLLTARIPCGVTLIGPVAESFRQRLALTGTDEVLQVRTDLAQALDTLPG